VSYTQHPPSSVAVDFLAVRSTIRLDDPITHALPTGGDGKRSMPDFLDDMERAQVAERKPAVPMVKTSTDWFAFRKRHPDLWIAKTGEDGSLEDWQQLLREEGQDRLTTAVIRARSIAQKGSKIRLADALAQFPADPSHSDPEDEKSDLAAAQRSKIDLLIWCVVHNPTCYADARCQWVDSGNTGVRVVPGWGEIAVRERICKQGTAVWEQLRDRAKVSQNFIFSELGKPCDARNKPAVYHSIKNDPRWLGYLRAQKLIP